MKINLLDKNTWNRVIAICSVLGGVVGALITYFMYRQK